MKIAVIGANGSIGRRHFQNARDLGHEVEGFDVVGSRGLRSERHVYDWCDAAVIATWSHLHEGGVRACIERGKHVLVEKPISTDIGGLPQLLDVADEKKLVVMMGNNLRFHPCIELAHLGHVDVKWAHFICATTTTKKAYFDDGVTLNAGSHEVDLALHLFGPAKLATATGIQDEIVDFVLRHENGIRSSFHLDFVSHAEVRHFWFVDYNSSNMIDLRKRIIRNEYANGAYREIKCNGSYDDDYIDEMKSFIDQCQGAPPKNCGASGRDGLAVLRLLLDIRQRIALPRD